MAHEIGHNHGRAHAPCGGPDQPDNNFPHPGATLGWWGFEWPDELVSPNFTDIMGYCPDQWISDYTYDALIDRVAAINGNLFVLGANQNPVGEWLVVVQSFEGLFWGKPWQALWLPAVTRNRQRCSMPRATRSPRSPFTARKCRTSVVRLS
jgi:hypothetical protein